MYPHGGGTPSAEPKRNQQKSIDYFYDRWVAEADKLKPPGLQIHGGQQVRKQSCDWRFGGILRPPSRMHTNFGTMRTEHAMGHSFHNPEVSTRVGGAASCLGERSEAYWRRVAPHLDPTYFVEAAKDVPLHGGVTATRRATTPYKPYLLQYSQPTTFKMGGESHYPPGQEPQAVLSSAESFVKQGSLLEKEADEVMDVTHHSNSLRKDKMYKEAYRMYKLASGFGSPEGKASMQRLRERYIGAEISGHQTKEPSFRTFKAVVKTF